MCVKPLHCDEVALCTILEMRTLCVGVCVCVCACVRARVGSMGAFSLALKF